MSVLKIKDINGNWQDIPAIKGATGDAGADGITPTIGNNGNWFIGDTDTGLPSRGLQGETGQTGATGPAGRDGVDGISPTATVTKSGSTATITVTDKNGTTTTTVSDGINGTNGTNGRDGYVQYTAGDNITIGENNVISATIPSTYATKQYVDDSIASAITTTLGGNY